MSGNADIWVMDADGGNRRQLTDHPDSDTDPEVSPDGRQVVFRSNRAGETFNIWRMEIDGGNPVQFTRFGSENWPRVSPDGRWVYYSSATTSESWGPVWKVPLEGGEPVLVVGKLAEQPNVSPDGKLLAYYYWEPRANPVRGVAVAPAEGGEPVKRFGVIYPANLRWTPDGRALAYLDERFVNVVAQPIDGGPPRQLTDFKFGNTLWFEWSRDGRTLALACGSLTSDAVLITDFR